MVANGFYQHNTELGHMEPREWLDEQETQGVDVSHIVLPKDLSYDEDSDQTLYFKEIRPCSILLYPKSSFCYGPAFRTLVLFERSRQASWYPHNRHELVVVYKG